MTQQNKQIDQYAAHQYGMDAYYEDWTQEQNNAILVNCIDPDYFHAGYKTAADQREIMTANFPMLFAKLQSVE